jgi:photosystem II stability/assembly factor-like uncharacterized protein
MIRPRRVALLAVISALCTNCGGCNTDGQGNKAQTTPGKTARWVARYRSPQSTGFVGTALSLFFYSSISVVSPKVVYVAGDMPVGKATDTESRIGVVVKTTDGGESWSESAIQAPGMQIPTLNSIHFVNSDVGWVVGADSARGGVLLKTVDGGQSWTALRMPQKQVPTSVFFIDADNGWIGGASPPPDDEEGTGGPSVILATTDGGRTWNDQIHLSVSVYDIFFLDKMNGWASGSKGTIYHTNDAGLTWNSQRTDIEMGDSIVVPGSEGAKQFRILSIQFTDPEHGFAAAAAEEEDTGRMLGTQNGGATWRRQWIMADSGLRDIFFANAKEGWALADQGAYVYHSVDGGMSWQSEPKVFEQDVTLVRLGGSDPAHVWAVGGAAVFARVLE